MLHYVVLHYIVINVLFLYQLHSLPRNLTVRTHYGGKRGSHTLTHRAQWENQDLTQSDSSGGEAQQQSFPELTGGYTTLLFRGKLLIWSHVASVIIMNMLMCISNCRKGSGLGVGS